MRHETIATEVKSPELKTTYYDQPTADSAHIWRWILATAVLCIALGALAAPQI